MSDYEDALARAMEAIDLLTTDEVLIKAKVDHGTGTVSFVVIGSAAEVDRLRADLADAQRERDKFRRQLKYALDALGAAAETALSAGGTGPTGDSGE